MTCAGRDDVWAVGDDGLVQHFDGAAWTTVRPSGAGARLFGAWSDGERVVAVGDHGTVAILR